MPTEREVLHKIINDHPEGMPQLFERHAALFLDGLKRFFPDREEDYSELLGKMAASMIKNLKAGHFDDVIETFYDWVVRDAWASFMTIKQEEAGGEHIDPENIFLCADRLSEAEFSDETRKAIQDHLSSCDLCRDLLEQCRDISVEVRHAGASYPESFGDIMKKALEKL